ncbi:FecR family protein [Steroidobacter sp.]|uniref:FecR family protein n=1 Tax=Steroidobacter sp. TaxID=1978227 RepID=UPI001A4A1312|nr:FecR domain-containing protein [Steroidobacter sp.]MBL8267347.1 FecR domain-containing protein [Steroidobacter sp.]
MESSKVVKEQAAQWLVKQDSGEWSADDQAELQQWLDASTAHVVAYIRLEAAWQKADRLKSLGAGVAPGTVPSSVQWQLSSGPDAVVPKPRNAFAWTQRPRLYGIAAGIAGVVAIGVAWMLMAADPSYRTPVGGLASVPMPDGSKVTLNTDSVVRIALSDNERRVRLDRGEAYFEVAKDPTRPFVVVAGNQRVIAVGTAFSVKRGTHGIEVAVTEGKVRIEGEQPVASSKVDTSALAAGSVTRVDGNSVLVERRAVQELEQTLSWRTGFLTFEDTTLADAVNEFNRYSTRRIVISDPSIAAIRLTGKFESAKYEAFVRLLEDGFSIRAERDGEQIVLQKR